MGLPTNPAGMALCHSGRAEKVFRAWLRLRFASHPVLLPSSVIGTLPDLLNDF